MKWMQQSPDILQPISTPNTTENTKERGIRKKLNTVNLCSPNFS